MAKTWACGDCGHTYPMSVDYCTHRGLDMAMLIVGHEVSDPWRFFPIYLQVADDLNIEPPLPPRQTKGLGPTSMYREGSSPWWAASGAFAA